MALKDRVLRNPLEYKLGEKSMTSIQKYIYPEVTRRYSADDVIFINYGYEEDPPMAVPLDASDEPNRYCIQLYHRTATQAGDLAGKRVLEVGCGHGGGASYLTRTFSPASYTGLDLNPAGIAFCTKRHQVPGLDFVEGNAESLPFSDGSVDAVVNIESSSHYLHFDRFLDEVARVLRPGGHLLYADCRTAAGIAAWEEALANAPLRMVDHRDISEDIYRGLRKTSPRTQEVMERRMGRLLRTVSRMQAMWLNRALQGGRLSYRMYCFEK